MKKPKIKIKISTENIEKAKRRTIRERVPGVSFNAHDFSGTFESAYATLSCAESAAIEKGYTNLEIERDAGYDDTRDDYSVLGDREERLSEVRVRLERLARNKIATKNEKEKRKERELKELERLAKKHGKELR